MLDFAEHGIKILKLADPDGNKIQLSSALEEHLSDEAAKP